MKKTTEEIIAANGINNASDAALVRLAGLAVAMPNEEIDALVKRTTFSHPRDAATARAVIESIRANSVSPVAPKHSNVLVAALAVAALGLGVLSVVLALQLSAERQAQLNQVTQFNESLAKLQSSTAADHAAGEKARNDAVGNLAKSWAQAQSEMKSLAAENAQLKADAAARAKADASQKPGVTAGSPATPEPKP
jgi:hypothetical protein